MRKLKIVNWNLRVQIKSKFTYFLIHIFFSNCQFIDMQEKSYEGENQDYANFAEKKFWGSD